MAFPLKNKIFVIFILFSATIIAQRNSGIKIGLNYSWTSTNITSNPDFNNDFVLDPTLTYHFGYSWNIKVSDKWSVQTDLIYNWKGSVSNYKNPNDSKWMNDYTQHQENPGGIDNEQFVSLPITLTYMVTPHIFTELGGELSLSPSSGSSNNLYQLGIVAGVGYSTYYVDVLLRYSHDLTSKNIIYGSPDSPYYGKYRTLELSFTIPVFKHLKRKE